MWPPTQSNPQGISEIGRKGYGDAEENALGKVCGINRVWWSGIRS